MSTATPATSWWRRSWSFSTQDRRRQVTVALTPDFPCTDPDDAVDALLDKAFCG